MDVDNFLDQCIGMPAMIVGLVVGLFLTDKRKGKPEPMKGGWWEDATRPTED